MPFPSYGQQHNQDPPIRLFEAQTLLVEGRPHPFLPESPLLSPLWASLPQKGCRGRGLSVSTLPPSLHCWRRMQPTQRVSVDWRAVQGGPQKRSVCSQEGVPGLLSHLPTTITSAETGVLSSSCPSTALPAGTPAAPPLSPQHSLVAPPRDQHNDPLSEGPGIPHSAWGRSVQWLLLPASSPRRLPHSSEVPTILNSGFLSGHESLGNSTHCHFSLTDQW